MKNLLSTPQEDFWRLVSLTVVGGYFGFAFATPLRKFFIIYVARELRLVFPSSSATAMTIRSMHAATTGEAIAKLKMRALSIAFSAAFALRVASQYATGILWDWHLFTWFYIWSGHSNQALAIENWGWLVEWTPAFIGVGILVGLNTAFSFFAGSVLAWGIVGPTLVHHGEAFGVQLLPDDPKWSPLVSFASLSVEASNPNTPSPRFWLLWPGVLLMIAVSFAELALQYKVIFHVFRAVVRGSASGMNALMKATMKKTSPYLQRKSAQIENDMVEDPAADHELVKWWMWSPLLVMSIILCCVGHGRTIRKARRHEFALRLPRLLLLLPSSPMRRVSTIYLKAGLRRANNPFPSVTDITPLTAASKASQIILGGATQASNWPVPHAQQLNLLGGSLASIGANQASDLTGDFRVGFLLRTPPFQQWLTQGLGTVVAVFLSPAMFMLFAKAYPCILDPEIEDCPFGAPSVAAWRAVAVAITDETFPVPRSSGIFSIVFAIFGVLMVIIRQYAYLGRWEKYRVYHPNMMCVGLAFVLPQTHYGTAMVIGAVAAYFWAKRGPGHFDVYGFAVAAGLIAGEGIGGELLLLFLLFIVNFHCYKRCGLKEWGSIVLTIGFAGVVNAIFQIAGISGDVYGSNVGCPAQSC